MKLNTILTSFTALFAGSILLADNVWVTNQSSPVSSSEFTWNQTPSETDIWVFSSADTFANAIYPPLPPSPTIPIFIPDILFESAFILALLEFVSSYKAFEKLCDIGASEFLMPYDGIMRDLSEDKLVLGKIFALHKKYNVSIEALCHRISELTDKPICFAFLQEEILYGEKRYRIRYAKTSEAFKTPSFKFKNTLLLKHTVINSASFSPCDFSKEKEILYINNRPRGYYAEPLLLESFNGSPSALLMLHSRLP